MQATHAPTVFAFDTHAVRTLLLAEVPWFVAKDVCAILEIEWKGSGNSGSLAALDDDEKAVHIVDTAGGAQEMAIISESGLYALIFRSRKPQAKRFRKWVTSEVLPAIRRTGRYGESADGQVAVLLAALIERMDQRDQQMMAFMASTRRPSRPKAAVITREHHVQVKTLHAEGMPTTEIAESLGISRTAVSLLIHDKYPFSRCGPPARPPASSNPIHS